MVLRFGPNTHFHALLTELLCCLAPEIKQIAYKLLDSILTIVQMLKTYSLVEGCVTSALYTCAFLLINSKKIKKFSN